MDELYSILCIHHILFVEVQKYLTQTTQNSSFYILF